MFPLGVKVYCSMDYRSGILTEVMLLQNFSIIEKFKLSSRRLRPDEPHSPKNKNCSLINDRGD